MSTRTEEVKKAERAIKDAEIRQRTVHIKIEELDKELAALEFNEYVIQDNIDTLKQEKIITLANEYRKAKEDLKKIRAKKLIVSNERVKLGHQHSEIVGFLQKALEVQSDLLYRLEHNVLQGNFGKQKDGQA